MEDLPILTRKRRLATEVKPSVRTPKWAEALLYIVIALALVTTVGGLLWDGLYRDSEVIQSAWFVNDLVTLTVVVPLMLSSRWFEKEHQSLSAGLLLDGLLLYLFYNYAFYLFGAVFNAFFLFYIILVAGSFYALSLRLLQLDWFSIGRRAQQLPGVRWVGAFMIFIALPLLLAEGGMVLGATLAGTIPDTPTVIFALDLTIVVPASFIAGILIWQRRKWGYLLSVLMSVKALTYGIVLTSMTVYVSYQQGQPIDPLLPFYGIVAICGGWSTAYLLRAAK